MDSFYKNVVIVAFVILLLALVGLGVVLQNQDRGDAFPPVQSKCPDQWVNSVSGCYVDKNKMQNVGDLSFTNLNAFDIPYIIPAAGGKYVAGATISSDSTNYEIVFSPLALPCDKRKWANMHGIIWDGISNYNQC